MNLTRAVTAFGVIAALVATGCSGSETATRRPGTTSATAATSNACDAVPFQDDDLPSQDALLTDVQLPSGRWTNRRSTFCRWSASSQDLLSVAKCAATASAEPLTDERSGTAKARWVQKGSGLQLDDQVELYPSRRKADALRILLASPELPGCVQAMVRRQAADAPKTDVRAIKVSRYEVGVAPAELGADFVNGMNIAMVVASDGKRVPVVLRVVTFGMGGGLGTVTVTANGWAGGRPDLNAVDLPVTVRTAARNLTAIF